MKVCYESNINTPAGWGRTVACCVGAVVASQLLTQDEALAVLKPERGWQVCYSESTLEQGREQKAKGLIWKLPNGEQDDHFQSLEYSSIEWYTLKFG